MSPLHGRRRRDAPHEHRTYVSSIELGKVKVSIKIASKLAEGLEVRLSEIWREIEGELG